MPLPILETSKYTTVVQSTKETLEFRPFLVKEEKILLLAQESDDSSQIIGALKQVIKVCTFNEIDPNKLTTYDLEYIFLQLRAKSVGETSEVMLKCRECEAKNPIEVNLSDITVKFPEEELPPFIFKFLVNEPGLGDRFVMTSNILSTIKELESKNNFHRFIVDMYTLTNPWTLSEQRLNFEDFYDVIDFFHFERPSTPIISNVISNVSIEDAPELTDIRFLHLVAKDPRIFSNRVN